MFFICADEVKTTCSRTTKSCVISDYSILTFQYKPIRTIPLYQIESLKVQSKKMRRSGRYNLPENFYTEYKLMLKTDIGMQCLATTTHDHIMQKFFTAEIKKFDDFLKQKTDMYIFNPGIDNMIYVLLGYLFFVFGITGVFCCLKKYFSVKKNHSKSYRF